MSSIVEGLRNALIRYEGQFARQKGILEKTVAAIEALKNAIERETGQPGLPLVKEAKR